MNGVYGIPAVPPPEADGASMNLRYARSHGKLPFVDTDSAPVLPATLRSQFQCVSERDLANIEQRMSYEKREQEQETSIQSRVAAAREKAVAAAQGREARARLKAERHAKVAGVQERRRIQEEYQDMCRW